MSITGCDADSARHRALETVAHAIDTGEITVSAERQDELRRMLRSRYLRLLIGETQAEIVEVATDLYMRQYVWQSETRDGCAPGALLQPMFVKRPSPSTQAPMSSGMNGLRTLHTMATISAA